jgi:predicted dehydrogenase
VTQQGIGAIRATLGFLDQPREGATVSAARLRVAIVGTGQIGRVHVECARRAGADIRGLVGSSPVRAQEKADAWGIPHVYADLAEAIADDAVDVIHVASPNHLHAEQSIAVAQGGRNVICEKPLALDASEGAAMVAAAQGSQVVNATCFNFRFYPLMHEARAMVQRGDIGEPRFLTGSYHQDWLMRDTDWNWRLETNRAGRLRAVSDIGSHWIDLVSWIANATITDVLADLHTFIPVRQKPDREVETFSGEMTTDGTPTPIDTDDAGAVLLRMADGMRGAFTVSQISAGRKNDLRFEIAGTEASLMWSSEASDTLWIGRRGRTSEILLKDPVHLDPTAANIAFYPGGHVEGYGEAFTALFQTVYRDVINGGPSPHPAYPTFQDGYRGLLVADAIWSSNNNRTWVALDEA